jgi:hypothetical protein
MSKPATTTTTNTTKPANTTTNTTVTKNTTNTTIPKTNTTTTPTPSPTPATNTSKPSPKNAYIPSLTDAQFEQRFGNRYQANQPSNFLGYSANKPFNPPLSKTTQVLSDWDKNYLLLTYGPTAIGTFINLYI